jgi:hypothetical protein
MFCDDLHVERACGGNASTDVGKDNLDKKKMDWLEYGMHSLSQKYAV